MDAPEQPSNTAVSVGTTMEAALYFDYVAPLFPMLEVGPYLMFDDPDAHHTERAFDEILPPWLKAPVPKEFEYLLKVSGSYAAAVGDRVLQRQGLRTKYTWTVPRKRRQQDLVSAVAQFLETGKLRGLPFVCEPDVLADLLPARSSPPDAIVTLTNLRLVDTSNLTWRHLGEFRRDREAKTALRRLRMFARQNFTGKERACIEDDLHIRIADYERTSKKWGFDTCTGAVSMLLESKVWKGAATGSLVSALAGAPDVAMGTAAGALAIELGRVGFHFAQQRSNFDAQKIDNPISYITMAKDALQKAPA